VLPADAPAGAARDLVALMKSHWRKRLGRIAEAHPVLRRWAERLDNWWRGGRVSVQGQSNRAILDGVRMVRSRIRVEGSDNHLEIGPGTRLFDSSICVLGNSHRIIIGSDCVLGRLTLLVQSSGCKVSIGDATTSGSVNIDVGEPRLNLIIGRDCMISQDVEIMCGDAHSLNDSSTGRRLNPPGDVAIGDHVWLAAQVAVLKGATIGEHCTIGFRSTVTAAIPAGSLAVGTPARVIRSGVTWSRELDTPVPEREETSKGHRS
jgi:acetyltransferase-like isoleucine patch superfamily enzyme